MNAGNMKRRNAHFRLRALRAGCFLLFLPLPLLVMTGGCRGRLTQFRITNATGKEVAVTSGHTQETVRIRDKQAVLVPHTFGDITVTMLDGKTWVYRNISPLDLKETPFIVEDTFSGSLTVNLLLNKDRRVYVIPPDAKDIDVEKLEQPKGFPVKPAEKKAGQVRY